MGSGTTTKLKINPDSWVHGLKAADLGTDRKGQGTSIFLAHLCWLLEKQRPGAALFRTKPEGYWPIWPAQVKAEAFFLKGPTPTE
jgi:hypothetical protein